MGPRIAIPTSDLAAMALALLTAWVALAPVLGSALTRARRRPLLSPRSSRAKRWQTTSARAGGLALILAVLALPPAAALTGLAASRLPPCLAVLCVMALAAMAATLCDQEIGRLLGRHFSPWWRRRLGTRLALLGAPEWAQSPWLALLVAAPVALAASDRVGLLAAPIALACAFAAIVLAGRLVDIRYAREVARADVQFTGLLPELAAGLRRGEDTARLLSRLEAFSRESNLGYSRLVTRLLDHLVRAAMLGKRHEAFDLLRGSDLPTARLVGHAWSQGAHGVDASQALEDIARISAGDHAFQAEVRGSVGPVATQGKLMTLLPIGMLAVFAWVSPETARLCLQPPGIYLLVASALLVVGATSYFHLVTRSLG
ncbi:MAG: hypothetical protein ABIO70_23330 [Pseudomonadota bacterium]